MATRYLDEDPESSSGDIFRGLQGQLNRIAVKKQADLLRKREQSDKIRQTIIEAVASGKMKSKEGATFGDIPDTEDVGSTLGYLSKNLEPRNEDYETLQTILSGGKPSEPVGTNTQTNVLGGGKFKPKQISMGGITLEREPTEEEIQKDIDTKIRMKTAEEGTKGLPIETGGKLAMVKQAKNDIEEVRQMLFPDGTAKSFKRGLATASNLPGSRTPIIGAIIPQAMPFNGGAQKIYSRLQNAVAAKLRVETGAQANPSEVENILARFGITGASSPEAAFDALQRLENFMDETINITDPGGRFTGKAKSQYKIGQTINKGGKAYTITGFDTDGEPLVDEKR